MLDKIKLSQKIAAEMKRGAKQLGIWIEGERNPWLDVYTPEKIFELAQLLKVEDEKEIIRFSIVLGRIAEKFLFQKNMVEFELTPQKRVNWIIANIAVPAQQIIDALSFGNDHIFSETYENIEREYIDSPKSWLVVKKEKLVSLGSNKIDFVELSSERDVEAHWFHNRDPNLRKKLEAVLSRIKGNHLLVLYTAGSYSRRVAKAKYALQSRLAFVDADEGADITKVPLPSRRVSSSTKGQHWFYILSRFATPDELQAINKFLTVTAGGDHGHSPAKKFRLPGFPNLKYTELPLVRVITTDSFILDVDKFVRESARYSQPKCQSQGSELGVQAVSPVMWHNRTTGVLKGL